MKLGVYVGSIVDPIGAHAIVNASNPAIGLGSGVSGAIREACGGADFQREVRERREEEFDDELAAGDCLVTSSGTCTAFRWVLHVAGVDYRRRDPETGGSTGPRRIRACMQAALTEASDLAASQDLTGRLIVATPLLGAGHGGLGPVLSLDAMLGGLREHLRDAPAALAKLIIAVLTADEARLVGHAAAKHGFPLEA